MQLLQQLLVQANINIQTYLQISLLPAEKRPTVSVSISVTPQIQTFINTQLINRRMCFSHVLQDTNNLD